MKPYNEYILVELQEVEEKTTGGIIVTGASKDSMILEATIEALGPNVSGGLKVGLKVGIGKYAGVRLETTNKKKALIKSDEVLVTY